MLSHTSQLRTIAVLALTAATATLTAAQNDCGDFVAPGNIALGVSVQCGIGSPAPNGLNNVDCGVQASNIFGPGAKSLSWVIGDICGDKEWSNGWVVGCDSEDRVTLVVHNDSEYYVCEPVQGACQVSFGGFSTGYYGKTWDCQPGA